MAGLCRRRQGGQLRPTSRRSGPTDGNYGGTPRQIAGGASTALVRPSTQAIRPTGLRCGRAALPQTNGATIDRKPVHNHGRLRPAYPRATAEMKAKSRSGVISRLSYIMCIVHRSAVLSKARQQ